MIASVWKERLHAWLGGCVRELGGTAVSVGVTPDHVHCLAGLKATHCLSDFMRVLKSESSEWIHKELKEAQFQWQEGYGAFTVSPAQLDKVRQYILNREEDHRVKSFQDEYVELLRRAGVSYDEKYLW